MKVSIRFFALTREITGLTHLELELPEQSNITDLKKMLITTYPQLGRISAHLLFASKSAYLPDTQILKNGDDLACFPPVSGG